MLDANFIRNKISDSILMMHLNTEHLTDFGGTANISAIDLGYGYVKYIKDIINGDIVCDLFPSQAAYSPEEEISGDFFTTRNTKRVSFGGNNWEVGPDVYDIISKNDVRAMHEDFISTEQWMVLFLGTLAYIDKEVIDVLILGLPVNNMGKEEQMKRLVIGDHVVGDKTYKIKDVLVVPQPLGALYNHAVSSTESFERFSKTTTLIVDPGYLTFDFLVSKGFKVISHRSGARPGGMNAVLCAISKSISEYINDTYDDHNELDMALDLKNYSGVKDTRPIYIYGDEIDLNDHIHSTRPVIDASLNFMHSRIGWSKDIAQIIMGGGPSKIFEKSIRTQFSKHEVNTMEDGIFSNVIGFMYWGMILYYAMRMKNEKMLANA
ncbi:PRTRC system protein D [Psychromonas sp. SP041]|uniref:PRTRC system protein D n=1 Tax=Psychromonas sp. SP041 TaxID=1365007 RepID=UPI0003F55F35|nr:PRTRC system protein D [Psychromonas sp. SP041]